MEGWLAVMFAEGLGDGFGEGVFAVCFKAGGKEEEAVGGNGVEGPEVGQGGFALGQGSGFVEEDGFDFGGGFEGGGVFDEDAEVCAFSGGDDESGGGREP